MPETASSMLPLGTQINDFSLPDVVSGQSVSLAALPSNLATVVMFICNHCPYVKHIQSKLVEVAHHYQAAGISFVAINSNDTQRYPADGPDNMRKEAARMHYTFPFLFDEGQQVARAFHAACTPDFYILSPDRHCVYRGRFDGSTPGNSVPVTGNELSAALDNIIAGKPVNPQQWPSLGCNIKWKS